MRLFPNRLASEIRLQILDRPTTPAEHLARLCGITIQQVAGYRAAHTLKTQRQRSINGRPASRQITARPPQPTPTRRSTATRPAGPLPRALKAQFATARKRAEHSMAGYLKQALKTTALIAKTLKAVDRHL